MTNELCPHNVVRLLKQYGKKSFPLMLFQAICHAFYSHDNIVWGTNQNANRITKQLHQYCTWYVNTNTRVLFTNHLHTELKLCCIFNIERKTLSFLSVQTCLIIDCTLFTKIKIACRNMQLLPNEVVYESSLGYTEKSVCCLVTLLEMSQSNTIAQH